MNTTINTDASYARGREFGALYARLWSPTEGVRFSPTTATLWARSAISQGKRFAEEPLLHALLLEYEAFVDGLWDEGDRRTHWSRFWSGFWMGAHDVSGEQAIAQTEAEKRRRAATWWGRLCSLIARSG